MLRREATLEEIVNNLSYEIKYNRNVRFRHFVKETSRRNAKNGVAHRQYSRSKVDLVEGVPHVMYSGKKTPITGTFCTLENGKTFVTDIRIKSEHLKAH